MMAIIRCKDCGKVCAASRGELCAACARRTRQAEVKVAEYLNGHPEATAGEIQQATGVERQIIARLMGGEYGQAARPGAQRRGGTPVGRLAVGQG